MCTRTRYALTPPASDFRRFARLLPPGWYKLPHDQRKRRKRDFCVKFGNVRFLLYLCAQKINDYEKRTPV